MGASRDEFWLEYRSRLKTGPVPKGATLKGDDMGWRRGMGRRGGGGGGRRRGGLGILFGFLVLAALGVIIYLLVK
jgi:hypothetical protein